MLILTGLPAARGHRQHQLPVNILQLHSRYNVVAHLNFICDIYFSGKKGGSAGLIGQWLSRLNQTFSLLLLPCAISWVTGAIPAVLHPGCQMP